MKKKLLVFLLTAVIVLGALGLNAFAGTDESATTPVATALWTADGSVTVDGSASEAAWMFDSWIRGASGTPEGSVAKLWNGTDLYLAFKTDGAASLKATLNGKVINVTLGSNPAADMDGVTVKQSSDIVEMKVPFASIGFVMHGYTQQLDMVLELKNSVGTSKFDGKLTFNGEYKSSATGGAVSHGIYAAHYAKFGYTEKVGSDYKNPANGALLSEAVDLALATGQIGATSSNGTYQLWNRYQDGKTNYMIQYSRVEVEGLGKLTDLTRGAVLDFDVKISDLAECKDPTKSSVVNNQYQTAGFGIAMCKTKNKNANVYEQVAVSIANVTNKGLVLYVKTGKSSYDSVVLNRQVSEDIMHMSVRYGADESLAVFIDDVQVYYNPQLPQYTNGFFGTNQVMFNLWNPAYSANNTDAIIDSDYIPLDSDYNSDVTVSNVKLGTLNEGDLLESLTFDSIKGNNSEPTSVSGNLDLPAKLEDPNGKFSAELVWSSSPAGYIAADGKVTPPQELTNVVLTATVVGSDPAITKSFELTVSMPPVDAWKADSVNFDGNTEEYYNFARGHVLTAEAGKPAGSIAARWTEDTLYIGAKYENAEILAMMVGDKVIEADLVNKTISGIDGASIMVGTGTAEIALPLSALELEIGKGTSVPMGVILAGTAGENGKSLLLSFYGASEKAELAWADSITVDGKLSEKAWQMYHKATGRAGTPAGVVGQLWNGNDLYVAVDTAGAQALNLTVAGQKVEISDLANVPASAGVATAIAKDGDIVEIKIPFGSFYTLYNYGQIMDIAVELIGSTGTSGYFGELYFSSKEYKHSTAGATQSATNAVTAFWKGSVSEALASGQIGYSAAAGANGNYTYRMWNKYVPGQTNQAIQRIITTLGMGTEMKAMEGTITVDFDLCVADMAVYSDPTSGWNTWRQYQPVGLGIGLGRYNDNSEELQLSVTNMEDGLVMFVGYGPYYKSTYGTNTVPHYGPFALNKQVGDQFHMSLHYTADGKVAVYVDDVLAVDFQDAGFSHTVAGQGIQFNLWSPYYNSTASKRPEGIEDILNTDSSPKNSDFDMDVEISNVKLGSTTCDNIFDLLSFDTIKGLNASEELIASDLSLPATLSDGSKLTAQLVWGSSNKQIVDGTGKVTTPSQSTDVTVTATLKGSSPAITKSFDLTVITPALDAWKGSYFYFDRGFTFTPETGKPSGTVAARWDETNLYVGVEDLVGDSVSVTAADETFSGTDVITIPLSKLGVNTVENGMTKAVAITLTQGNVTVTKNLSLSFFGAEEDALAAYGNITVDGTKDAAWEIYHTVSGHSGAPVGQVGFLWNNGKLYVGAECENADKINLIINGKTAYIDLAALTVTGVSGTVKKTDSFLEIQVAPSDFGFELLNYTQTVPVTVELVGAGGVSAFATELGFTSKAYNASAGDATQSAANAVTALWGGNIDQAKAIGQIGYTSDKNADGTYTYRMWNKYVEGQANQAIQRIITSLGLANEMKALDGTITVDFDLCVADMPEFTDPTSGNVTWRQYQPVGLGIGMGRYNDNSEELNIAVTNMEGGLVMFVGYGPFTKDYGTNTVPYYGPFSLGKQVGDQFHLTLHYTEDGKVAAYVDDTLVMEYQDGGFSFSVPGQGVQFNLWSPYYNSTASKRPEGIEDILNADSSPKNSDFDMDVEISNVKVGNLTCDDLLDLLTFDTIKGLNVNADLIMNDLELSTTLTDGRLAAPLNWVSSNEAAISTTGVVNTDNEGKVTLTAKLGGQDTMSKKFNLTVAANVVDAWKGSTYTEGRGYTFNPAGNATGEVNARWDDTNLYLQLENTDATKFTVVLNNKSYTANVSGGKAEVKVALADLNLGQITNTTVTAMNVTLTGSNGSASKKLQLSFFGVAGYATANWEDSITVNGATDEGAWQFYRSFFGRSGSPVGKLSALWGNDSLYIGVNAEGVNKVHLTLNGKKATVDLSTLTATGMDNVTAGKTDKAIEIAIPFASFDFKLYNYGQTTPVLVELEGEGGTSGFAANLAFTAKEHAASAPEGEYAATNAVTTIWGGDAAKAKANGQIGMTSEKDMNGSYTYHIWNKYVPGKTNYGIQRINVGKLNLGSTMQNLSGIIALDMDLRIDDMPAYDDPTSGDIVWRQYQPAGLGFALGRFNTNEEELNLSVTNTKNGLALYVGYGPFTKTYGSNTVPYYGPFYIDRELGEEFHLTFHYTEDGQVSAYVDDVLVMDFQDGGYQFSVAGLGVGVTLWNPGYDEALTGYMLNEDSSPKNAEANSDVYVGNLKVGSVSCYDLRDLITFDTIKGLNGSPDLIGKDLTLPTTVSDGNKLTANVSWSSSNTKVIANNGKVTTQDKNMAVKLTAKIGSFTKDFDLTVVLPAVDAWRISSANVNGTLAEYYDFTRGYTMPEGTVNGAIAARWNKNTLYLAGKTNGDTMTVVLGGKTIVANLSAKTVSGVSGASIAVGNGTVELGIPMSQLKLGTISQGTAKPMNVTFAKGSAKVQKNLSLTFYGVYETSMSSWNDGTIEIDGVLNEDWLMYTETTGRVGSPNGVIGKMWHESDLFLAVDTDGASQMIVSMGGKTATIDLTAGNITDASGLTTEIAKQNDIVEMKISFKDFFTLVNYGQVIDATIELVNEVGASGFNGGFEFTSREHLGAMNAGSQGAGNPVVDMYGSADDAAAAVKSGQVGYTDVADENGRHTYHMWNKYQAGKKNYSVQRVMTSAAASQIPERFTDGTGTVTLDFDVRIDDMPVYDDPTSGDLVFRKYQAAGLGILVSRGIEGEELNFVISNTKDGLVLYIGYGPFTKDYGSGTVPYAGPYKLNKAMGQEFHVMIHYTEKGEIAFYADDVLIATYAEAGQDFSGITDKGLIFSLWSGSNKKGLLNGFLDANSAPKNSKADTDITISDVRFGASSGTDILDLITYETIQNLNGDANSVVSNLKLPSSISDGKITAKLSWTSSNRGVITNGGTVYPPDERTPVTMTVSLVGAKPAITKSFPLTAVMPFIDTWQTNFVKIDGDLSEYYNLTRGYSFAKSSGKPSATVAAGWNTDRSRLYYAIKYNNTDKITITMGSQVLVVDLVQQSVSGVKNAQMKMGKNNTVEIAVPLDRIRITEVKNDMLYDIGVKLENAKSSVAKNLTLVFCGKPSTALASWDNKTVVVDGKIEETSWLLYTLIQGRPGTAEGSFGRLWNGSDLYLAIDTDGAKKLSLQLGEKTMTVDLTKATPSASGMSNVKVAKDGDFVELKIPMKSFGFTLHNYTETVNMKLELSNAVGTSGFYGVLQMSSREALFNGEKGEQSTSNIHVDTFGDETVVKAAEEIGQIGYTAETTTTGYAYHMWNIYQEGKKNYPVQRVTSSGVSYNQSKEMEAIDGIMTVDFNVRIDDMPEYKDVEIPDTFFRRYQPAGLGIFVGRNLIGEEINFVITNELKGLAMYMGSGPLDKSYGSGTVQWSGPYYIGKELGDQFHVSVHQTMKGEVQVYIDDEILFAFKDVGENFTLGTSGVVFSLWNQWYAEKYNAGFLNEDSSPKNADANSDVTVSDVQIGTATCYDLLDYLDFDYIKGNNGAYDDVIQDLKLPGSLTDGKLKASLSWESSKPEVVTNKGKVTTQSKDTTVILKASLTGTEPVQYKELEVSVALPPVDSWYNESVKLDGKADEYHNFQRGYNFAKTSGKPTGSVGAAWDTDMMYVGFKYTGADEMNIKIEGKTLKVDLAKATCSGIDGAKVAVGSGVVELAIPRSIIREISYERGYVDMVVTLIKGDAETEKGLRMTFYGETQDGVVGFGGDSMKVDGSISEIAYQLYGQTKGRAGTSEGLIAKVWSGKDLYLAMYTDDAKTVTLTLNGKTATINPATLRTTGNLISKISKGEYLYYDQKEEAIVKGTLLEMKIPFSAFGFDMYAYNLTADMTVEMTNNVGVSAYSTKMAFTNKVSKNYIEEMKEAAYSNQSSGHDNMSAGVANGNIGATYLELQDGRFDYRMWNVYAAGAPGWAENVSSHNAKSNDTYEPMIVREGDWYMDFDVKIDDMIEKQKSGHSIANYGNDGLNFWLERGIKGQELTCGICYIEGEGLVFTVRNPETATQEDYPIDRQIGEKFHVSILWEDNGDITVFIDDEKLSTWVGGAAGTRAKDTFMGDGVLRMNLWSTSTWSRLANDTQNTDFTVSNILIGYAESDNLLDQLTFDTIKGENRRSSEVWKDLVLPKVATDGVVSSDIVWESSNPAVISIANGVAKVTPQDEDTKVTLTVRMKGNKDIYKTFEITVTCPIVDAQLIGTAKTGSFKLSDGSTVAARWDKDNIYLDITGKSANGVDLTFGDKKITVANGAVTGIEGGKVTVSGGKATITLPRTALGITIPEYHTTQRFTVAGKALKLEFVGYESIADEYLNSQALKDFVATLKKVTGDITLPQTYTSQFVDGKLTMEWSSDTLRVLDNNGKLTRPEKVDTIVRLSLMVDGKVLATYDVNVIAKGKPDLASTNELRVPFGADIKLDGKISEQGWSMNTNLATADKVIGKMGVQWDTEYLYMAFQYGKAKALTITLDGKTANVNISNASSSGDLKIAQIKKGSYLELKIALKELGLTNIIDYGEQIAAKVMLDGATFDGTFTLSSMQWFATDNPAHRYVKREDSMDEEDPLEELQDNSTETTQDYVYAGWYTNDNGYYMYDIYGGADSKAAIVTAMAFVKSTLAGTEVFAPMEKSGEVSLYTEFDIQPLSMPIYKGGVSEENKVGSHTFMATAGLSWQIGGYANKIEKTSEWLSMGMYYNEGGLNIIVRVGKKDFYSFPTGKQLGDMFRIGVGWDTEDTLHLFVDGEKIGEVEKAVNYGSTMSNGGLQFRITRNANPAACESDSFKINISNMAMGYYYGECMVDNITFNDIRDENINSEAITMDLNLLDEYVNPQLSSGKLTWESTGSAIAPNGKVTRPEDKSYELNRLTVTNELGHSKEIVTAVKGFKEVDDMFFLRNDYDTYHGVGEKYNGGAFFDFDLENTSVIKDLKETKKISVVKITALDNVSRMDPDNVTLWVSDDNANYTPVKNFKLLHKDNETYLYGFEAEGRYVKVHSVHFDSSFVYSKCFYPEMLDAYYEETFGDNGQSFGTKKTVTVKNKESYDMMDMPWTFTAQELGIVSLAEDMADVRIFCGDELLYHYAEDGMITVRIPEVKAGGSVKIKVLSGNKDAMDISNKEGVHEVLYGTREMFYSTGKNTNEIYDPYYRTRCMAVTNDGTIITTLRANSSTDENRLDCRVWLYSKDHGRTWTYMGVVEEFMVGPAPGGMLYDNHANVLYSFGYTSHKDGREGLEMGLVKLDLNNGVENAKWEYVTRLSGDLARALNYNDGTVLSCYDGEGPNVDMVIMLVSAWEGELMNEMVDRCVYTTDAGKTWIISDDAITIPGVKAGFESGVSEPTTLELDDGTLVMTARYQDSETISFAYAYSLDHGVTWSDAVPSEIYTINTQPMFLETHDEFDVFCWAGNNIQGGESYQRYPMNLAIPVVAEDRSNIKVMAVQNTYQRGYFQNLQVDSSRNTNLFLTYTHDGALLIDTPNSSLHMLTRVDDYKNYITKTKGSYDSFENSTTRFEGWSDIEGMTVASDVMSTDGKYSMQLFGQSVRSVPYFRTGSVSFDLYWDGAEFKLELETTYHPDFMVGSPTAFIIDHEGNVLDHNRVDTGIDVAEGWNKLDMNVDLPGGKVTVAANGSEAADLAINSDFDEYVTYIALHSDNYVYVDNFTQTGEPADVKPETKDDGKAGFDLTAILLIGVPVLVAAAIALVVILKKKGVMPATKAEETQNPETPDEQ